MQNKPIYVRKFKLLTIERNKGLIQTEFFIYYELINLLLRDLDLRISSLNLRLLIPVRD